MSTPNNGAHGWARRFQRFIIGFIILGLGLRTAAILAIKLYFYLITEYRWSADGNTLALTSSLLGSARVMVNRFNEKGKLDTFCQLGQKLYGDFDGDYFG
jgi:hypothetical protein